MTFPRAVSVKRGGAAAESNCAHESSVGQEREAFLLKGV